MVRADYSGPSVELMQPARLVLPYAWQELLNSVTCMQAKTLEGRKMKTVEGVELTEKQLAIIEPGEIPTFAAKLSFATVGDGDTWKMPLLLLTNRRFIISKDKLLGKPKANFAIAWPDVSTVGSGSITPIFIELIVQTARETISVVTLSQDAAEVEGAIRAGYLSNPNHPAHRRR